MRQIAVIGAGPSGCYVAEQLLRAAKDVEITVIERLPVPFGLVRYGVSPDHQGTKAIARLFDRALSKDRVHFCGHVEVGRDVSLAELSELYDAVVLAVGAAQDRRLGIPGESLPGVLGSAAFVGWYNNHPDYVNVPVSAPDSAVVIGNGNVALDVARMLAKNGDEFTGSDLSPSITQCFVGQPRKAIHIVGRRGPAQAKFTTEELAELGHLQQATPKLVDTRGLSGRDNSSNPNLETFANFMDSEAEHPLKIHFHFHLRPFAFIGNERLEAVAFEDAGGQRHEIPAQLAVSCIGYEATACDTLEPVHGRFANDAGHIADGLYVIGWAGRGPSGTIPSCRTEAKALAKRMMAEVESHDRGGVRQLLQLLQQRKVAVVDHAGWQRIDAAEQARAGTDRCREKIASVASMLEVLQA